MATFNKFNCLSLDIAEKKHDFSADAIKVMLTNTLPVATNAVTTDITEIAAGNGYTAGGLTVALGSITDTSGVTKVVLANSATLTASGAVTTFRYAVVYNNTSATKPLIGWLDAGSAISMVLGETFQVQFDATNGAMTIT